jgi:hypothetical protein
MILENWPDLSSIRVEIKGTTIPYSRKNGWSYNRKEACDGAPCIRFHGKFRTVGHLTSVEYKLAD